eukprot:3371130-Pyramimonas_sp.AAC.1
MKESLMLLDPDHTMDPHPDTLRVSIHGEKLSTGNEATSRGALSPPPPRARPFAGRGHEKTSTDAEAGRLRETVSD